MVEVNCPDGIYFMEAFYDIGSSTMCLPQPIFLIQLNEDTGVQPLVQKVPL